LIYSGAIVSSIALTLPSANASAPSVIAEPSPSAFRAGNFLEFAQPPLRNALAPEWQAEGSALFCLL
jgi:hypothetical protein